MPTFEDCYPWQAGGCEWTVRYLWQWTSSFTHLDIISLALMFLFVLAVDIHILYRYSLRARSIDRVSKSATLAILHMELGAIKSIALTAPYFGLAGTCVGSLGAFGGVGMEMHAALTMIATKMALAVIPTIIAIPVAVLARCSYDFLQLRVASVLKEEVQRGHSELAGRFPLQKRFSELPAFGLIAAPMLALGIAGYMMFGSFHRSTGYDVDIASTRCQHDGDDRSVVLHITASGKLFLNDEEEGWNTLAGRLSDIYAMRKYRTLNLLADPGVPFQTVADVIDRVENEKLGIRLRLLTPEASNQNCIPEPVAIGSGHHVSK